MNKFRAYKNSYSDELFPEDRLFTIKIGLGGQIIHMLCPANVSATLFDLKRFICTRPSFFFGYSTVCSNIILTFSFHSPRVETQYFEKQDFGEFYHTLPDSITKRPITNESYLFHKGTGLLEIELPYYTIRIFNDTTIQYPKPDQLVTIKTCLLNPNLYRLLENITILDLSNQFPRINDISTLLTILPKTFIRILIVSYSQLDIVHDPTVSEGLKNSLIVYLNLSANELHRDACHVIANGLPNTLLTLDLSHNPIGDDGWAELASQLPYSNITSLDLSDNYRVTYSGCISLSSGLPPRLEKLNLSRNRIGSFGCWALVRMIPPTLTELNLSNCTIMNEGCSELSNGLLDTNIRILNLSNCLISKYSELADGLPVSIEHLTIRDNNIDSDGVHHLASRLQLSTLKTLDVSCCSLTSPLLITLVSSLPPTMETFLVSFNKIEERTEELVSVLPTFLKKLCIDNCSLSPEGIIDIMGRLPPTLEYLNVTNNIITKEVAEIITAQLEQHQCIKKIDGGSYYFIDLMEPILKRNKNE